jgi:putative aldouronate transport system permease protein
MFLMILIPLCLVLIFSYGPMYGLQIAFKDFRASEGIWGSQFVGLKHFKRFLESRMAWRTISNTLFLSLYSLVAAFPIPVILAICLNCCRAELFKRTVQTVTYAPYFISTVVLVSMVIQLLAPKYGLINNIITALGGKEKLFMAEGSYFRSIYVWSGIWQHAGWSSIIYLAALTSIDPVLHEAAIIDGASRFKRILYIDIPGIIPTLVIILILDVGNLMNVGFEKILLMQNATNTEYSEVISTYVYKIGIAANLPNYSFSTAIGLFSSVINFILLVSVNAFSRWVSDNSLW